MAGVAGFEPTDARVKVSCLTTWLYPNNYKNGVNSGTRTHDFQSHNLALYQLNYIHHKCGTPEGIRTPDTRLRRAVLYPAELLVHILFINRIIGAGDGNRTHATSLEGWGSTIELHPHNNNHFCKTHYNNIINDHCCQQFFLSFLFF